MGLALSLPMQACGGASRAPKSFEASYTPANAPLSCTQTVDPEGHRRCLAGDGDGCTEAVRRLTPTITFADAMKLVAPGVHGAQMECIVSYASRGCNLGSGSSCAVLGIARALLGDQPAAHAAWVAACDGSQADSCWYASGIGATEGRWAASDANVLLAERGCDLGSFRACAVLAELALFGGKRSSSSSADMVERLHDHPGDIGRGYRYWERACLLGENVRRHGWSDGGACEDLRKLLTVADAPRRNDDDLLPILSQLGPPPPPVEELCLEYVDDRFTGNQIPCSQVKEKQGPGGICEVDPSACPTQLTSKRPHPMPPLLDAIAKQKRGHSERTRILDGHRALCARGDANECMRGIELELMRFPYDVYRDERTLGEPPAFDAVKAAKDLCARGGAEACTFVASLERDTPSAIRACDLGSARGCAVAGNRLGRAGPNAQRASKMFARACSGGIRWACGLR
jgi:hypothetical protein